MKYSEIKQFPFAAYKADIAWDALQRWITQQSEGGHFINLEPDYQRGYVWSQAQKIAFVEYQLRGGFSGKNIFWNHPTWLRGTARNDWERTLELVDGKQRISAALEFLDNKIPVFGGNYAKDFEDRFPWSGVFFSMHVNNLRNPLEVLDWYLGLNTGGSIHTLEDLQPAFELKQKLLNGV